MRAGELIREHLEESARVKADLWRREGGRIESAAELLWSALRSGKKVLICGNGGSAADAQHLAAEWVGRYETERRPYPAIALTTDTSALTALANDYGYDSVFARQVDALGSQDDVLIAISTSGNSKSVLEAVRIAKAKKIKTVALSGETGGVLASAADICIRVPSKKTSHIQESHIAIAHVFCAIVDYRTRADEAISAKP